MYRSFKSRQKYKGTEHEGTEKLSVKGFKISAMQTITKGKLPSSTNVGPNKFKATVITRDKNRHTAMIKKTKSAGRFERLK